MDSKKSVVPMFPTLLLGILCNSPFVYGFPQIEALATSQLEQKLTAIDLELEALAQYSLRSGIGVIGYRSDWRGAKDRKEWIEVELEREFPIDEIVLVPTIWRDTE